MPDTTTPDPIAAALDEIQERSERPLGTGALPIGNDAVRRLMESAGDVPRLVQLARNALALVDGWDDEVATCDRWAKLPTTTEHTARLLLYRSQAFTTCAAQARDAISAALLGEGDDDA